MQENKQTKYSSKLSKKSIQSRKSNVSSIRSLERPSWSSRNHSLNNKKSLIEVMSLESSRKSDIYDKMLNQDNYIPQSQFPHQRLSNQIYGSAFHQMTNNEFKVDFFLQKRKSNEENPVINHTCECYAQCYEQKCQCFMAKDELCIKGYCCASCIDAKNKLLQQKPVVIVGQKQYFCTCKKTKCNKKYCSCFNAGVKCGIHCSCEGCINCDHIETTEMEVEQENQYIGQQQLAKMQMPEKMDFEPVEFRFSNT